VTEETVSDKVMSRRELITITALVGTALVFNDPLLSATQIKKEETAMAYTAKDYTKLIGMEGFSETLLKNHFTLYQGYVTNTNKVLEALDQMLKSDKTSTFEFAEIKRRLGWEFNGMRLHEYYFENLGSKAPLDKNGKLAKKMAEN
jgi:Fe-Mn family superoxide dismutase